MSNAAAKTHEDRIARIARTENFGFGRGCGLGEVDSLGYYRGWRSVSDVNPQAAQPRETGS